MMIMILMMIVHVVVMSTASIIVEVGNLGKVKVNVFCFVLARRYDQVGQLLWKEETVY